MLAHVGAIPVEEALLAAPALLTGASVIAGYVRATAGRAAAKLAETAHLARGERQRIGSLRGRITGHVDRVPGVSTSSRSVPREARKA